MPIQEPTMIRQRLMLIEGAATAYFRRAAESLQQVDFEFSSHQLWSKLPADLRQQSDLLIGDLIALAREAGPAVRRSPLLSEADSVEVGHAVKGMRAALKLGRYQYWGPEVLHDEDIVLGVRPAGQSDDNAIMPTAAAELFETFAHRLEVVLDLVGAPQGAEVSIIGTALSAPAGYRPGSAFIMMWMDRGRRELEDIADTIKRSFANFGIHALRADDIEHEDVITKRILDEIRTAEFLFADLTGERPSVYYEVGYAHALGRRVMLFRHAGTQIHFDLAAYNCPEYANLRELERLLTKRLEHATGEQPREFGAETSEQQE
jgi:hypothetical protein